MSFRVQRLANRYPGWSKLRRDPSSMGQRFLSTFGEYFDEVGASTVKLKNEFFLNKRSLGLGYLYRTVLAESDWIKQTVGSDFNWPVVTGTSGSTYSLTRVESLEDLMWKSVDRLSLSETVTGATLEIWNSATPTTYGDVVYPERLSVHVYSSTEHKKKLLQRNTTFSDVREVAITGTGYHYQEIVEKLPLQDDGVYYTSHVFRTVTKVEVNGVDGTVSVAFGAPRPQALLFEPDPYRVGVLTDLEGPVGLRITQRTLDLVLTSFLDVFTTIYKAGWKYRAGDSDVFLENEELLAEQVLLDDAGAEYDAVDLAINPDSTKLYVLDASGKVHIYDYTLNDFIPPTDTATTNREYVTLQPQVHRARYKESLKFFTWLQQPRYPILGVTFKRIAPDDTVEYLQSDKVTWGVGTFEHLGTDGALSEDTWADFDFNMTLDQAGMWQLYATARTKFDTTVSYTAVTAEVLTPETTLDLTAWTSSPDRIYFSHQGKLAIIDGTTIYLLNEHYDAFLADATNQVLFFRENYTTVGVTYA